MSVIKNSGFTLIETMLFLAITGVLIVAILAGTGSSINIQRYRDSVSTFKDLLQQQYSEVSTVRNETRPTQISCNANADISTTAGPFLARGQSNCVVLGRLISVVDTKTTISTVVGNTADVSKITNDITDLQKYKLSVLDSTAESSQLEWGARIAWPVSGSGSRPDTTPRTINLLIMRSPLSGLTYTFSSNDNNSSSAALQAMVVAGTGDANKGQSQRRICVDSDGGFAGGLAVVVGAYASTATSIQVRSNDMGDGSTC